jgi:hypothetical protein
MLSPRKTKKGKLLKPSGNTKNFGLLTLNNIINNPEVTINILFILKLDGCKTTVDRSEMLTPISHSGNRLLIIFIDIRSRIAFIYFMTSMSEINKSKTIRQKEV